MTYRFKYLKLISAIALECYECTGEDHLCSPGLLGKKSICKPDVTHCLKTWTGKCHILLLKTNVSEEIQSLYRLTIQLSIFFIVETSPKTKRACGTSKYVGNKCKDLLFGQNTMLYCPCNNTNFCNAAGSLHSTNLIQTFFPHHPYQSQPKVAFFALVLIFHSFHHIAATIQTYLYS